MGQRGYLRGPQGKYRLGTPLNKLFIVEGPWARGAPGQLPQAVPTSSQVESGSQVLGPPCPLLRLRGVSWGATDFREKPGRRGLCWTIGSRISAVSRAGASTWQWGSRHPQRSNLECWVCFLRGTHPALCASVSSCGQAPRIGLIAQS